MHVKEFTHVLVFVKRWLVVYHHLAAMLIQATHIHKRHVLCLSFFFLLLLQSFPSYLSMLFQFHKHTTAAWAAMAAVVCAFLSSFSFFQPPLGGRSFTFLYFKYEFPFLNFLFSKQKISRDIFFSKEKFGDNMGILLFFRLRLRGTKGKRRRGGAEAWGRGGE